MKKKYFWLIGILLFFSFLTGIAFSQTRPNIISKLNNDKTRMLMKPAKGQSLKASNIISFAQTQNGNILFSEDFENNNNWTFQGNLWQIGQPTSGPYIAHSGSRCAATNLNGNYADDTNAGLVSKNIALPQLPHYQSSLALKFWQWYETESSYDYCTVWISTDNGQNWTKLETYDGSQTDWSYESIDLTDYASQNIRLDFYFTSDASINYAGWYIDDITVELIDILYSNHIEIAVSGNGQFTMGKSSGPVLLYGHPQPWTSATSVRIDGQDYWNYARQVLGNVITSPTTEGLQNIAEWEITNNIIVRQTLRIVQGGSTGNYDTGEIRYTVTNNDATTHSIGIRIMLDTMLGLNDGAPFRIPGTGSVTTEMEWNVSNMPPYYQAFDDLSNPTIQSQGTLIGGNAKRPDLFVATGWQHINDTPWDYSTDFGQDYYWGDYGYDSAVGIYWYPVTIGPDESKEFVTYYGLGGIDIDLQPPLVVGLSAPNGLVFINGQADNNPFSLSVYLSNTSPGVTQTAVGITTILNLPNGLILPAGENALHNIPNMQLGAEHNTSYLIEASATASGQKTYSLTVNATNITSKTVEKKIYLIGVVTSPTNGQSVNSSLNTITARFNVGMNSTTINESSFLLFDESNRKLNSTVTYNSIENKAILTIQENLQPDKQYKVRLSSSILTNDGFNLPYDVEWYFSTTLRSLQLIVRDANNNHIQNKEFNVYKVNDDLTDILKGKRTTNSDGEIVLDPSWFTIGDQIKIEKIVHTEDAVKSDHEAVDGIMYQIKIDNGKFDEQGNLSFHQLTDEEVQNIVLDHTTIMYNLVVSVEWDADQDYLENLLHGFRYMSNYLYDVTDGQLYINKVAIYDNKINWDDCDVQIFANNLNWPKSIIFFNDAKRAGGIWGKENSHLYFSRIQYSDDRDDQRNWTYSLYPYEWTIKFVNNDNSIIFPPSRALGHEIMHYCSGLLDEYCDEDKNTIFNDFNFGIMDNPLAFSNVSSEMSSAQQYSDEQYRKTMQWIKRKDRSCWDYFKWSYEDIYEDIFCPIIMPDDRENGNDLFWGPNNNLENPQYDVGSLLASNSNNLIINPSNNAFMVDILNRDGFGFPIKNSRATLYKNNRTIIIEQGRTADNGRIRVLGANNGDIIRCYARIGWNWFYSEIVVGSYGISLFKNYFDATTMNDSAVVILRPVSGNIKMVNDISFQTKEQIKHTVFFANPLSENPNLEIYFEGQSPSILAFSQTEYSSNYSLSIDGLKGNGLLNILAKDDSLNSFFINQNFIVKDSFDLDLTAIIYNFDASSEMTLDSSNIAVQKMLILSSDFNPILEGLEENVEQGGAMHTISSFPDIPNLKGVNILTIRYADSDLKSKLESTLRIFKWDGDEHQWKRVGGEVDTIRNEVTAEISSFGTYAAFTTKAGSTDEKLDNNNCYFYPNPFNPNLSNGHFVFGLQKSGNITLKIYDASNVRVKEIIGGNFDTGSGFEIMWDGKNENGNIVANGVYFYVIESSSGEQAVGKIAVLR